MTLGAECLYASLGRGIETTKQEIEDIESEEEYEHNTVPVKRRYSGITSLVRFLCYRANKGADKSQR